MRSSNPVTRATRVPPVHRRGGKTFTQTATTSGDKVIVARTIADKGKASSAHSSGGKHKHHTTTTVRHYHYHYWGYGYYYCYLPYWYYYPWFWAFYFAPFPAPWHYHWWWWGSPWYGYWGWYYAPYTVYVGPSYWVTDYTLARMLEAEYERGWEDGQAAAGTPITEPVKEQIRLQIDEVARFFQEAEALLLERALEDPDYLFIVDTPLSVATDDNNICTLTGGDIVKRAPGPVGALPVANMVIVTSKTDECRAGSAVSISYADLQEMLNTFGQIVDDGLNELQERRQE